MYLRCWHKCPFLQGEHEAPVALNGVQVLSRKSLVHWQTFAIKYHACYCVLETFKLMHTASSETALLLQRGRRARWLSSLAVCMLLGLARAAGAARQQQKQQQLLQQALLGAAHWLAALAWQRMRWADCYVCYSCVQRQGALAACHHFNGIAQCIQSDTY
jgi:hypothetical protein